MWWKANACCMVMMELVLEFQYICCIRRMSLTHTALFIDFEEVLSNIPPFLHFWGPVKWPRETPPFFSKIGMRMRSRCKREYSSGSSLVVPEYRGGGETLFEYDIYDRSEDMKLWVVPFLLFDKWMFQSHTSAQCRVSNWWSLFKHASRICAIIRASCYAIQKSYILLQMVLPDRQFTWMTEGTAALWI